MQTQQQIKGDIPELLSLMVEQYNVEAVEFDRMADYVEQLESDLKNKSELVCNLQIELANAKSQVESQAKAIGELKERNNQLESLNERNIEAIKKAEPIARAAVAQKRQLEMVQSNLAATQKELTALKGGDNPKRLREQIKRNKDKNAELTAKNERLQREAAQYRADIKAERELMEALKKELYEESARQANKSFTRLYTEGEHHVMLWPEVIKAQCVTTGEVSEGRALLYMHNSMRGALLTLDEENGTARMGASPKGGLRLSKATKDFADSWLYKVNALQGGDVKVEDLQLFSE